MINESPLEFYRRWGKLERPYLKWQFKQFSPYLGKRIADIGCGIGNFVEFLKNKDLYFGLEPNQVFAKEFNTLHQAENLRLAANGDITTNEALDEMRANQLDSALCVNTLEHIANHKVALSNMIKGVGAGGSICILVPAHLWLYGSLDQLDGHYRRYSKKTLLNLTKNQPVKIIKCYYLNFFGAFGWFVKGRILKEKIQKNANYKIINTLLPLISLVESIAKPPIGMSLVLILEKYRQDP